MLDLALKGRKLRLAVRLGPSHLVLLLLGPGELVPVPPSPNEASGEPRVWVTPPWEQPLEPPTPELLLLLEESKLLRRRALTLREELPSWKEIFPAISQADRLLKALLAPEEDSDRYYLRILAEALRAGFRDPTFLFAVLWHAPYGEDGSRTDKRTFLSRWHKEIQSFLEALGGRQARSEGRTLRIRPRLPCLESWRNNFRNSGPRQGNWKPA